MTPPLTRATFKRSPEDFVVEELPAYLPSGEGEHLFIRFTKRNVTTHAVVQKVASALGVHPRDVGVAGLKDKVGVATQTISVPTPRGDATFDDRARALAIDGVTMLEAKRHGNKLKTGHLAGNRFSIVLHDVPEAELAAATARLADIVKTGVPNAFGPQRFGRDGDNPERALAWLSGRERAPRDARIRRLMWSALQSKVFNAVLAARVADGTWTTPLVGDLVKRHDTGGLFPCTDEQIDRERAVRGEVSPTGPIVGAKMRWPGGRPFEIERRFSNEILGNDFDLEATRALGEGTRRALRLWVDEMRFEPRTSEQGGGLGVYFVLPKGAYATTVLGAAFLLHEPSPDGQLLEDEP